MSRCAGVLLLMSMVEVLTAQSKLWIDSQGNRYEIEQSADSKISLNCPDCKFETSERIYDVTAKLPGVVVKDGAFEGRQAFSGGDVSFHGWIGASAAIRLKVEIPGVEKPFDFILVPAENFGKPEKTKPASIVVKVLQPSATIGQWVPLSIHFVDATGRIAPPEKDTLVQVEVQGGTAVPALARITQESPKVPIGISPGAKLATAKITVNGMSTVTATAIGCSEQPSGPLTPRIEAPRRHAFVGDPAPVLITLVDSSGVPATDNTPRQLGFDIGGVGVPGDKSVTIAPGQCAAERDIAANSAGRSVITADLQGRLLKETIVFRPAITLLAIALTLAGGFLGSFIAFYQPVAKAKFRRWLLWLVFAWVGAVLLHLAYFYGLLELAGGLPGGDAAVGIIAVIGGFLGAVAFCKIPGQRDEPISTNP